MVLVVDIGNSTVALGLHGNGLALVRSMDTHPVRKPKEYRETVADMLRETGTEKLEGVAVASVVSGHMDLILEGIGSMCRTEPVVAGAERAGGLSFDMENPGQLGPDRIASAVAAAEFCGTPVVVVDCGSATTVNFVGAGPVFRGGAILPGLSLMARALGGGTSRLPEVAISGETSGSLSPLGKNTEESIRSGIIYGTAGAVMHIIDAVEKAEGEKYKVALTGGYMDCIRPHLRRVDLADPHLVLKGLAIIYGKEQ